MSRHIALPITLATDGSFRTVEEDSREEIVQNIVVILRTRLHPDGWGERLATPTFGTSDPVFVGFDAEAALDVVRRFEPRADVQVVQQAANRYRALSDNDGYTGEYGSGYGETHSISGLGVETVDLIVQRRET